MVSMRLAGLVLLCMVSFLGLAQNSGCFSIESVLVDACGSPEGPNEMVRFRVGAADLNTSNLFANWPNNAFLGICQNAVTASHVSYMNSTVVSCGYFQEPVGGVLPAGANVLFITSVDFDPTAHDYAGLTDTLIVIFQCGGNTAGHFANWISPCDPLTGDRTLTMSFGPGCQASVTYNRCSLTNQFGEIGGTTVERDGARVDFDNQGNASYANDGCTIPYVITTIEVAADPAVICLGGTTAVSAVLGGFNTGVVWSSEYGEFDNNSASQTSYSTSESVSHYIYASSINGCGELVVDSVLITVVETNPVQIELVGSGCAVGDVQLTAVGDGDFIWNTGESTSDIFPDSPGLYTVVMQGTCGTSEASIEVEFGSVPICGITQQGPLTICFGSQTTLTAFSDSDNWSWSAGGATGLQLVVNQPGYYVFTSINNCGVCVDSILVQVADVLASFTASPTSGPAPLVVNVTNTSNGGTSYNWLVNGQFVSSAFEPEIIIDEIAAHELTLVVTDANGCNSAFSVTLAVWEGVEIEIPNVFTPNNDGVNDYFGITINSALPARVVLLNRWGNVIREEDLITKEGEFTELWDGKINQIEATSGVYFYKLEVDSPSGEVVEYTGFFNLFR